MDLDGRKIVLGLTGGVACYKSAELTRALVKAGASVQVVMTEAATHFMTPVTMQAVSGKPVYFDQWDARIPNNMPHIDLTRDADASSRPARPTSCPSWRTAPATTCSRRCAWPARRRCRSWWRRL